MIDRLRVRNFKSLRDVDLKLGAVNLFVGLNASGKSNVLDALRLLQGLSLGLTVPDVLDGTTQPGIAGTWSGIRGGRSNVLFRSGQTTRSADQCVTLEAEVRQAGGSQGGPVSSYSVELEPSAGMILRESLSAGQIPVFDAYTRSVTPTDRRFRVYVNANLPTEVERPSDRSYMHALGYACGSEALPSDVDKAVQLALHVMREQQQLDPRADTLRAYAARRPTRRMGPAGEGFAAVVDAIIASPEPRASYLSWLNELSGANIQDVEVLPGAANDLMFALRESGGVFPAPVLSDGTLRFAALVAAFFQPDMPSRLVLEEIENGLHPNRIRLLYLLLRERSARTGTQVFATTHSPVVLTWLRSDEEFAHTFLCRRDEATGETRVIPVSELPGFVDLARQGKAGDLLVEGWLESAS